MEINKAAAESFLALAKSKFEHGDENDALRLAQKSARLHATPACESFLSHLAAVGSGSEAAAVIKQVMASKDHYATLGIEHTANLEATKQAYHDMALKVHPDKNHASGAEEAFKKVLQAWTVLADTQVRAVY